MVEYTIEIKPSERDGGIHAVTSVLSSRGYPAKLQAGEDFDWIYHTPKPLDTETVHELQELHGVRVRKFSTQL